ncbi:hypothetical protein FOA52_012352 [Chlamydomonas sp. UWO 241]|nr:hypothetical protein FOA52_012352 [Chlamydomonas sp. UWO 241]
MEAATASASSVGSAPPPLRFVLVSDTHGLHHDPSFAHATPKGDVLIFAGDAGLDGDADIQRFEHWLKKQPHKHKVVVFGNMDAAAARGAGARREPRRRLAPGGPGKPAPASDTCIGLEGATVICDRIIEVGGYRIAGSPWTPAFYGQWQLEGEAEAHAHWRSLLPPHARVDVLVTHGPPAGYGDTSKGRHVGDAALMAAVQAMEVPPKLWVVGHIHESYGVHRMPHPRAPGGSITLVNAAVANLAKGDQSAAPRAVDLPSGTVHEPGSLAA